MSSEKIDKRRKVILTEESGAIDAKASMGVFS
jgi:hypothetical protein